MLNPIALGEDQNNLTYLLLLVGCLLIGMWSSGFFRSEKKGEEPRSQRIYTILLFSALIIGAGLRLYGVDFGLPDSYHPDEFKKARLLKQMKVHQTIDPQFTLHPPLLLYFSWGFSIIIKALHFFPENGIARNLLAGRMVSVVAGTISIYLVYLLGRRMFSKEAGVFAALFLAISPLHVTCSRYMKEDVLFTMFVLACAVVVLKSCKEEKPKLLLLAGLLAGFAFGSKYTGVLCVVFLSAAPWLVQERFTWKPEKRFIKPTLFSLLMMGFGFLVSVPYIFLSIENVQLLLRGFQIESRHAATGHLGVAIDAWSQMWMFHFSRSIIPGFGFCLAWVAILGVGLCLRRWQSKELFVVLGFLIFYLTAEWAKSKPLPQPDRYVLACIPFLSILAGSFVDSVRQVLPRQMFRIGICFLLMFMPLLHSLQYASELRFDTRKQMRRWMAENLPPGSKVMTMGGKVYLPAVPLRFSPVSARKVIGRDEANIVSKLKTSSYDYLLLSSLSTTRFAVEGDAKPHLTKAYQEIKQNFPMAKQIAPRYGSYGFHNPVVSLYLLKGEIEN